MVPLNEQPPVKKQQLDLRVRSSQLLNSGLLHLCLEQAEGTALPLMLPGQFVEVAVDKANVLLNRPYSIYNCTNDCLELLVAPLGRASVALQKYAPGEHLRVIAPLGHGFRTEFTQADRVLLIGGGVGIAPLYYQARTLREKGINVEVVYGSRSCPDEEIAARFREIAPLHICTDDGSAGFKGLVTQHPVTLAREYNFVQVCGPQKMMESLHGFVSAHGIDAEFSLENKMACGLGACLCCVENTKAGNICVCTDGPVFNYKELTW